MKLPLAPASIIREAAARALHRTGIWGDAVYIDRIAPQGDDDQYPSINIYTPRESSVDKTSTRNGFTNINLAIEVRVQRYANRPADAESPEGLPSHDSCMHPANRVLDSVCMAVESTIVNLVSTKIAESEGYQVRLTGLTNISKDTDHVGQADLPHAIALMDFAITYEPCYDPDPRTYCDLKTVISEFQANSCKAETALKTTTHNVRKSAL